MMIETRRIMRMARLTVVAASFAVGAIGTETFAGDKQKAQKAVDQLAAQMQADGTVPYAGYGCDNIYYEEAKYATSKGGEIKSDEELKRLIMFGNYEAKLCIVRGSQSLRLAEQYLKRKLLYYPLAVNHHADIIISRNYSYGSTWQKNGSVGTYDIYRKYFDDKKTKYVSGEYIGTAAAYLVLVPIMSNFEAYKSESKKREFCELYRNNAIKEVKEGSYHRDPDGETLGPCLSFYPQAWDKFIGSRRAKASKEVNG